MPTIQLPKQFSKITDNKTDFHTEDGKIIDILKSLISLYPVLQPYIFNEDNLSSFMVVYLNKQDIRQLDGLQSIAKHNDVITLIPAISGG